MKKAIAIIDLPDFVEVKSAVVEVIVVYRNKITGHKEGLNITDSIRLKPVPGKKYMSLKDEHDDLVFQMGWNVCLDQILGEEE